MNRLLLSNVKAAIDYIILNVKKAVFLTILILPIQEHNISFHLFLSSFISILQFSEYRSCTSLGRFIPRYFILFDTVVSGIVSLIYLSDSLLLVYRNATDLCILILYPATLLNSLMSSFLVASLGFSMYRTMSSANSDSFTSSFTIWIPFNSLSSLIAVASTSKTMLNKSGESRQGNLQIQCNPYRNTNGIFTHLEQIILKFVWKHKRP